MQWMNLELDMLPAIAIETAKVIELYRSTQFAMSDMAKEVEMGHSHLAPKLK